MSESSRRLLNGTCGTIVFITAVSMVKNEVSISTFQLTWMKKVL